MLRHLDRTMRNLSSERPHKAESRRTPFVATRLEDCKLAFGAAASVRALRSDKARLKRPLGSQSLSYSWTRRLSGALHWLSLCFAGGFQASGGKISLTRPPSSC